MQELIKITEKDGQQLVSARELHEFLEVGRDFTTWIKARIEKYEFLENVDFIIIESFHQNGGKGGRPEKDYVLTIEMAKELSMVENSEKGKQARKYFIQCEKKLKEVVQAPKKLTAIEQLKLQQEALIEINEKVDTLERDMPLFKAECDELQSLVQKVGVSCLGGKNTKAYKDTSLRGRVYSDIQQQLRREFGVNKYSWIKHSQFNRAKEIINSYKLPIVLEDEIILINNQLEMEDI